MSGRSFPALGFDPTPGETDSVRTVLLALARAIQAVAQTLPRLEEAATITDDADWGGDAAEEFSDHGDDLPQGLGKGAEAMTAAADALGTWGGQMKANQDKAEDLEEKAKKLKKQIAAADAAVDAAAGAIPRDTGSPDYGARHDAFVGKVSAAQDLKDQLQQVIDDARRLEAKHLREANAAAEGVRSGPDDAFEPENDAWYVQTLDGVSKVSGIVSAATGAAAAGLMLTGIGAPVGVVLGGVSAGTAGVTALAGIGQRIAGSRNAPGNLALGLSFVPGRTFTSAAAGGIKALARPTIGASRLRNGGVGAARGAADGLMSGGLPKLGKDLVETGQQAKRLNSLTQGVRAKIATDGVNQVLKGDAKLAGEAFGNSVDATVQTIESSGGSLTAAQRRELEALKFLTNPGDESAQDAVVNLTKDELDKGKK